MYVSERFLAYQLEHFLTVLKVIGSIHAHVHFWLPEWVTDVKLGHTTARKTLPRCHGSQGARCHDTFLTRCSRHSFRLSDPTLYHSQSSLSFLFKRMTPIEGSRASENLVVQSQRKPSLERLSMEQFSRGCLLMTSSCNKVLLEVLKVLWGITYFAIMVSLIWNTRSISMHFLALTQFQF